MKEMITTLYEYDCWANRRIFDGAQQLSEQYRAPSAFGSLHRALSHLAGVEILWRTLAQDGTLSNRPPSSRSSPRWTKCAPCGGRKKRAAPFSKG